MDQEAIETSAPLVEEEAAEVPEVPEVPAEVDAAGATEEQGVPEPPTPRIPKKRAPRAPRPSPVVAPVAAPPPAADHKFWSDMLMTKRELDREATRSRYANLVKF